MQMKQVEMIVRVNVSVPLNTPVENLFVDFNSVTGMQVADGQGHILTDAKVNEYETMDVVPL